MIIETITIEFQPTVKQKVIAFLNTFSKNELDIIDENSPSDAVKSFVEYRDILHLKVKRIASGEGKAYNIDELDAMLEKTSSKYEN